MHALRPQALEKAAFADALRAIVKNTAAGTALHEGISDQRRAARLSPAVEENLLHIGQEALTNTLKHAHATNFSARIALILRQFIWSCATTAKVLMSMEQTAEASD